MLAWVANWKLTFVASSYADIAEIFSYGVVFIDAGLGFLLPWTRILMPKLLIEHSADVVPALGCALIHLSGRSILHRILFHIFLFSLELPNIYFLPLVDAYPTEFSALQANGVFTLTTLENTSLSLTPLTGVWGIPTYIFYSRLLIRKHQIKLNCLFIIRF